MSRAVSLPPVRVRAGASLRLAATRTVKAVGPLLSLLARDEARLITAGQFDEARGALFDLARSLEG